MNAKVLKVGDVVRWSGVQAGVLRSYNAKDESKEVLAAWDTRTETAVVAEVIERDRGGNMYWVEVGGGRFLCRRHALRLAVQSMPA
jgi:hypothetical protein